MKLFGRKGSRRAAHVAATPRPPLAAGKADMFYFLHAKNSVSGRCNWPGQTGTRDAIPAGGGSQGNILRWRARAIRGNVAKKAAQECSCAAVPCGWNRVISLRLV
jgi:hypothetical protein